MGLGLGGLGLGTGLDNISCFLNLNESSRHLLVTPGAPHPPVSNPVQVQASLPVRGARCRESQPYEDVMTCYDLGTPAAGRLLMIGQVVREERVQLAAKCRQQNIYLSLT